MKILFLDFDGVLNYTSFSYTPKDSSKELTEEEADVLYYLDPSRVKLLNEILDRTGAKVVVSSAWRCNRTIKELQSLLFAAGFTGKVIGKTRQTECSCKNPEARGDKIADWIRDSHELFGLEKIDKFVILDDYADMSSVIGFLVQTDRDEGLTGVDVEDAVDILNGSTETPYLL